MARPQTLRLRPNASALAVFTVATPTRAGEPGVRTGLAGSANTACLALPGMLSGSPQNLDCPPGTGSYVKIELCVRDAKIVTRNLADAPEPVLQGAAVHG